MQQPAEEPKAEAEAKPAEDAATCRSRKAEAEAKKE